MARASLTVLALLLALVTQSPAWELPEFMLSTWGGPEVDDDEARAAGLALAGLNTAMWDVGKIDVLRRHGLKALVDGATVEIATQLRGDPAVWGYHLVDEPETSDFPDIALQVAAFRQADPTHPAYVNLFARAGDHITSFIDIVRPDFLSYDFYQWWYGGYQKWWEGESGYFSRLEQHRDAASAAGIPLICWVEVTANRHDDRYANVPLPSDSNTKIRQSVYTSLAYGVKGIQWFHGNLLFVKGSNELNECGRHVATLNNELRQLGPVLLGLTSVNVFHTPPLAAGTREAPLQHWVLTEGEGLVTGLFHDADGQDLIMVTNRSPEHGQRASLVFQRRIEGVEEFDRASGAWRELSLSIREDRKDAYDVESIEAFLGVPTRSHERLVGLRTINSYTPPFQVAELMLKPGDGALLRITGSR